MRVFEKFIASDCPPENGSVLWINTSRTPMTLNMLNGNCWQVLGAFFNQQTFQDIIDTLGEFTIPTNTVAFILEYLQEFLVEATEQEIYDMFPSNS